MLDRLPLPSRRLAPKSASPHDGVVLAGEYGALTAPPSPAATPARRPRPAADVLAANASFRTSQAGSASPAILERLDGIINAYADVLRRAPDSRRLVQLRVRRQIQRQAGQERPRDRGAKGAPKNEDEMPSVDDLPAGPTIYGTSGRTAARYSREPVQDPHADALRRA